MTVAIQLQLGLDIIRSYKRLAYTPWHAIAELVDNSTQAYFNNRAELDEDFARTDDKLEVSIVYDRDRDYIRVSDNSSGMSLEELAYAMHVGARPANTDGRSKFGMGLKTAACWMGNHWTVKTKRAGDPTEHVVTVDVEQVADGIQDLPYQAIDTGNNDLHYTIVEITQLNRPLRGRTLGKIREFLMSMYRQDLRDDLMTLRWQGERLAWPEGDEQFLEARDGSRYKKGFRFLVDDKEVTGWVGVLDRGSRAHAGFSILHAGRVVRGWPDSWRPESIYGQYQGSNDLVNQRIIGEIHLDAFEVTHTKDDILWLGSEEDDVERELRAVSADYINVAKSRRKGSDDERGPSDLEIQTAVEEFSSELTSAELLDLITVETVPPPEVVRQAVQPVIESAKDRTPAFDGKVGPLRVVGYLPTDLSTNDPYVIVDAANTDRVVVIVNLEHPYMEEISGSEGVLNWLRQCTYDAIAEWQAMRKTAALDPDTVKLLKDRLLRLPSEIQMRREEAAEEGATAGYDG